MLARLFSLFPILLLQVNGRPVVDSYYGGPPPGTFIHGGGQPPPGSIFQGGGAPPPGAIVGGGGGPPPGSIISNGQGGFSFEGGLPSEAYSSGAGPIIEAGRSQLISSRIVPGPPPSSFSSPVTVSETAIGGYATGDGQMAPIYRSGQAIPAGILGGDSSYSTPFGGGPSYIGNSYSAPIESNYEAPRAPISTTVTGRRVWIYKKIQRPILITHSTTVQEMPGSHVANRWSVDGGSFSTNVVIPPGLVPPPVEPPPPPPPPMPMMPAPAIPASAYPTAGYPAGGGMAGFPSGGISGLPSGGISGLTSGGIPVEPTGGISGYPSGAMSGFPSGGGISGGGYPIGGLSAGGLGAADNSYPSPFLSHRQ